MVRICPECEGKLDAPWHDSVHELWALRTMREKQEEQEERMRADTIEVDIVCGLKRYKGRIPCVDEDVYS